MFNRINVPAFDPQIIARHITREFILDCMLERYTEGKTDETVTSDIPRAGGVGGTVRVEHAEMMNSKIIAILEELRDQGLLKEVPYGEDRGISEIAAWNAFVKGGTPAIEKYRTWSLMSCPLPAAINQGAWSAAYEVTRSLRKQRGFAPHADHDKARQIGEKAHMPITREDVEMLATAAALGAAARGSGMTEEIMMGRNEMTCRKTDARISWKEGALLAPVAGQWHYPSRESGEAVRFDELQQFDTPKPFRQIDITLPSGVLLMADWFRIPGFNEGVGPDDYSRPGINSDLGVDNRTRDHYERLGLMRIHTTNCVPQMIQDGEAIRIGYFDEDHDDYWTHGGLPSEVERPQIVGRICCDLWDATFADREILIDILYDGACKIAANDGFDERGSAVVGYPKSREEAADLIDAYARENDVARLEFAPGTVLQVSMASGHGSEAFFEKFSSQDLSRISGMEEMFIISPVPVMPDPATERDTGRPDWAWPERYSVALDTSPSP